MEITIHPYTDAFNEPVSSFNNRLKLGGADPQFAFPETSVPDWLPPHDGETLYQEMFVASDRDSVRGAYILKHQEMLVAGGIRSVGFYRSPISEGTVNRRYAIVGGLLLRDALKRQPLLFCLGMGSCDRPLPRMLKGMGWSISEVPFFFRTVRPERVFRQLRPLRTTSLRRFVLDTAVWTGAASIGSRILHRPSFVGTAEPREAAEFNTGADELWAQAAVGYSFCAVRSSRVLARLYPPTDKRFHRILIHDAHKPCGWAVVLDTEMKGDKYFGNLRLGSVIDVMALPGEELNVISGATKFLMERGVDLIISNQSHCKWQGAMRENGYRKGPSNFLFAASQALRKLLDPWETRLSFVHLVRGDGDGPIHL